MRNPIKIRKLTKKEITEQWHCEACDRPATYEIVMETIYAHRTRLCLGHLAKLGTMITPFVAREIK